MVIRYARMCAYMERASFGALSSFMYPLLCRFMHDLFLFLFFSLASRKKWGKEKSPYGIPVPRYSVIPFNNHHRSGVTGVLCSRFQWARYLPPVTIPSSSISPALYAGFLCLLLRVIARSYFLRIPPIVNRHGRLLFTADMIRHIISILVFSGYLWCFSSCIRSILADFLPIFA